MLPLFSLQEASALDHRLIKEAALSESLLIDAAASGAFEKAKEHLVGKRVLFVVGKGNNGSDALEMARLALSSSSSVRVLVTSEKGNEENLRRRSLLPSSCFTTTVEPADTIVDGLFGFGFHGEMEPYARSLVDAINCASAFVVSLDVPSGFLVEADQTVTFMCRKLPLYDPRRRGESGLISYVNPGFPEEKILSTPVSRYLLEESDYRKLDLKASDYKNTRGHLLVCGGSDRYPGAPILSCLSAFHSGAGLVSLLSVPSVLEKAYASYPSIMGVKKDAVDFSRFSAVLVGPGWDEGDKELLSRIAESGKPTVVDADALKLMEGIHFHGKGVLTPHLGEFKTLKRILGVPDSDTETELKEVAHLTGSVVVLKASSLWITDGEAVYVYDGSNPSLGVAGSGDT
ncbi:MAG: bifunctional ADP-dependent NAD(P)H-hydrate dehydratase/NAD(P)H-hydrate epimerase, partial [Spirochaetales bacterium]|nr:bifunctional ADP-dependent NAD(P)H-hydrate dehydratase/NAD(P)H-hydrate epimerase [Candidatus Physcosoma equi]